MESDRTLRARPTVVAVDEKKALRRQLKTIVKRDASSWTELERELVAECPSLVRDIERGVDKWISAKRRKLEVKKRENQETPLISYPGSAGPRRRGRHRIEKQETRRRVSRSEIARRLYGSGH